MNEKYKKALNDILMNLRCIEQTGNNEVDSYVDDSIRIAAKMLGELDNE